VGSSTCKSIFGTWPSALKHERASPPPVAMLDGSAGL
jgi:hypothetical protein